MKINNVLSALWKRGRAYHCDSPDSHDRLYAAKINGFNLEIRANGDDVSSIHICPEDQKADSMSDYFPGTFCDTIKEMLEGLKLEERKETSKVGSVAIAEALGEPDGKNDEFAGKLEAFRALVESDTKQRLIGQGFGRQMDSYKAHVHIGKKYARVDVGGSGMYMVIIETGAIHSVKGYGVIHPKHKYGTLDTISEWFWGGYRGVKKTL